MSVVKWYPHDTGLFTTSSADHALRIWDTNQMAVVDKFPFKKIIYTHSMAASETHSLIAGALLECTVEPVMCNQVTLILQPES